MTDDFRQSSYYTIEYDPEQGALIEKMNDTIVQITQVAAQMKEKMLREAVILELEKIGYTVIRPETKEKS